MFANWNLLIPPDKDKCPPRDPAIKRARLTSITYPRCITLATADTSSNSPPDLAALTAALGAIRKPSDITQQQLQLLNVSYTYDLPLSAIIPEKYHPDETDDTSPFAQRRRELSVENNDAYDFIARRRRDIKIGNFYRFFQAAETLEILMTMEESNKETNGSNNGSSSGEAVSPPGPSGQPPGDGGMMVRTSAKFREELLRHFVDPIAWGFEMRIYPPRYPPKLVSQKSLFNVKADLYLHQQPPTMQERKDSIIIGPALVLQTRNEDKFTETDDVIDAVHELSALLTLSQERQRKEPYKKIRYRAVGKDANLDGDDLFLFSAVHYHFAVSHVYLTDAYTRYLRTGILPPADYQAANPSWCACRIGRSKWYNLLEIDGRIDALRAVMAVLAWLKRDEPPPVTAKKAV
ncbi:hypothetical protein TWF696_004172 [Orbilia brochopaga]|uniref:Uncharacterized protein n=1 Tax=Orbilia brochopaga TaxID=3140254 RepID=A0AAV9V5B6_9PEZI